LDAAERADGNLSAITATVEDDARARPATTSQLVLATLRWVVAIIVIIIIIIIIIIITTITIITIIVIVIIIIIINTTIITGIITVIGRPHLR
jgi:hypothetical protein